MIAETALFEFVDDPAAFCSVDADGTASPSPPPLIVHLSAGLRSKHKLLDEYVRQLSLPDYFGGNWDALEECLRDLSWLDADRPIAIVHAGLPLRSHRQARRTYLELLRDVARFWAAGGQRRFRIVFPRRAEPAIASILAQPQA